VHQNQQSQSSGLPAADLFNLVRLVIDAWSFSVEAFLRSGFGRRYAALPSGLVVLLVPFYCLAWGRHDLRPMCWFLYAYLAMCVVNRVIGGMRSVRGVRVHSYYNGWPRTAWLLPFLSEQTIKLYIEPGIVAAIAVLIGNANPPLCIYLLIAAGALMFNGFAIDQQIEFRAQEMYDALLNQECVADRFRRTYGDRV
jgi:hypothetical protein